MAVDALATVATQFAVAAPDLRRLAESAAGVPDFHAPDAFFQTLAAAGAAVPCGTQADFGLRRPHACRYSGAGCVSMCTAGVLTEVVLT